MQFIVDVYTEQEANLLVLVDMMDKEQQDVVDIGLVMRTINNRNVGCNNSTDKVENIKQEL